MRLSDGTVMRLYRQTVEDFGIYPGLELTDEQMTDLRKAAGAMSAKMRAVRIVSATNVSRKDLQQRLISKGEDPKQAQEAVQWMEDLDLIDDGKTAELIVQKCIHKGYGVARAKQALYEKRIPKDLWEDALRDYPDQTQRIVDFLQAKLGADYEEKDLRRAMDALIRRGHSYQQIRRGLEQLSLELEEEYRED